MHTLSRKLYYKDSTNPISQHIQTFHDTLDTSLSRSISLNLMQNKYSLNNDLVSLGSEEGKFWQFEGSEIDALPNIESNQPFPFYISFSGYVSVKEYEVNYYSFWEFIGQLGGFYEILELFGMFFVGF